ncbi:endonuclease [Paenibacillus sp. J31TS4]|nr:endonuclease [Paenibacillus sp. J31TS4]
MPLGGQDGGLSGGMETARTDAGSAGETSGSGLRVMSLNVRNPCDSSPNAWEDRMPRLRRLLAAAAPDLIGTQECVFRQVKDMEAILPGFGWIGLGRLGGSSGEFCALFYRASRFEVLEYGHYWLSETPDTIASCHWGNTIPRMVTWAKLRDQTNGRELYAANTHFDHLSEEARRRSAELVLEKLREWDTSAPVVLTGDFNVGPGTIPYRTLTEGGLSDTWTEAPVRTGEGLGTFNNYEDPTGRGETSRIDWILKRGALRPTSSAIVTDLVDGGYATDHFPIWADLNWEE